MDEKSKIANLNAINAAIKSINSALSEVSNTTNSINGAAAQGVNLTTDDVNISKERLRLLKEEYEQKLLILNQTEESVRKTREWKAEIAEVQRMLQQIYSSYGQLERTSQIISGSASAMPAPASSGTITVDSESERQLASLATNYLPAISSKLDASLDYERSEMINAARASEDMTASPTGAQAISDFSGLNTESQKQSSSLFEITNIVRTIASGIQSSNEIERNAQNNINHDQAFMTTGASGWGGGTGSGSVGNPGGDLKNLQAEQEDSKNWYQQRKASAKKAWENFGESGTWQRVVKDVVDAFANGVLSIQETILPEMQRISGYITESAGKTDSRLYGLMTDVEGLNANFVDLGNDVIGLVSETRSMALLNEEEILKNVVALVNNGIAFNIEQRALWATMTDKIVSTFSVTNDTLLRSIKLQQTELTDTYMGIEAAVTRTLNSMYKDTQFLNNDYDTVWANLQDLIANTSAQLGSELVYQIEVWLGSLSSLGLSSNATSGVAGAINSMLTGNIDTLGDKGKVLMAMAAADAGMSFADLLVNGIGSGNEMNEFLQSMLKVLQDIYSQSKDNNVLLSEWGDILGLSISDWKAISNLQSHQINTLASMSNYSQADALAELSYIEDNLVSERTLIAERAANLGANAVFEGGWNFATSEASYVAWYVGEKLSNFLDTIAGGKGDFFKNSDLQEAADLVKDLATAVNTVTTFVAFFDPMVDTISTVLDDKVLGDLTYSQFKNTSVNGTVGDFSSELFGYLLNAKGYINYGNITEQSYAETNSKKNSLSKSASDFETVDTTDSTIQVMQAQAASGGSTNTGTGTTWTSYVSSNTGTQTTVQQTASNSTVGNSSANPSNQSTTYTIDSIYNLLNNVIYNNAIRVHVQSVEKGLVFDVNSALTYSPTSIGGNIPGGGSASSQP